jgi:hypothetical protein
MDRSSTRTGSKGVIELPRGTAVRRAPDSRAHAWPALAARRLLVALLAAVVLVSVVAAVRESTWAFSTQVRLHQWVSAQFMTIGRAFAESGFGTPGALQLQNNLPWGLVQDAYLQWPPLFGYLLGFAIWLAGDQEATGQFLVLLVMLATTAAVVAIGRKSIGTDGALLAGAAFLALPVNLEYAGFVAPVQLGILLGVVSVLAFVQAAGAGEARSRWAAFGCMALVLGIWSSWETAMVAPGVFLAALWNRDRWQIRASVAYLAAAFFGGVTVIGWYILQSPPFASQIRQTIQTRMGLGAYDRPEPHLYEWTNVTEYAAYEPLRLGAVLQVYLERVLLLLGKPGAAALVLVAVLALIHFRSEQARRARLAMGGLLGLWVFWFVAMANHAYIHEYQMLIAAPATALGIGGAAAWFASRSRRLVPARLAPVARAAILLLAGLAVAAWFTRYSLHRLGAQPPVVERDSSIRLGLGIAASVPENGVVLLAINDMVPVYYSQRSVVRGVMSDDILQRALPQAEAAFPCHPVYLAMNADRFDDFPQAFQQHPRLATAPTFAVLQVLQPTADCATAVR